MIMFLHDLVNISKSLVLKKGSEVIICLAIKVVLFVVESSYYFDSFAKGRIILLFKNFAVVASSFCHPSLLPVANHSDAMMLPQTSQLHDSAVLTNLFLTHSYFSA